MRFLHPGQASAAKFDRSRAALGWDGSLLHCKSQGQVVPNFRATAAQSAPAPSPAKDATHTALPFSGDQNSMGSIAIWTRGNPQTSTRRRRKHAISQGNLCARSGALHRKRRAAAQRMAGHRPSLYQTRQELIGYMGWPFLHPKAFPNSSKFCTVPFTRHLPGEWGSTSADCRADGSVWFWHHTCAKPMK